MGDATKDTIEFVASAAVEQTPNVVKALRGGAGVAGALAAGGAGTAAALGASLAGTAALATGVAAVGVVAFGAYKLVKWIAD